MSDKPFDMRFEFDISKFERFLSALPRAVAEDALIRTGKAGALVFIYHAKLNAENQFTGHPTGLLKESIQLGYATASGHRAVVPWGSFGVVYARIHEWGGIIHATNSPYLHFRTEDGAWHMVKSVQIPARPYVRPAMNENQPEAKRAMLKNLKSEIRSATGARA